MDGPSNPVTPDQDPGRGKSIRWSVTIPGRDVYSVDTEGRSDVGGSHRYSGTLRTKETVQGLTESGPFPTRFRHPFPDPRVEKTGDVEDPHDGRPTSFTPR